MTASDRMPFSTSIQSMASLRGIVYACTLLSGGAALVFQVVWQRYLALLVGSEARSISLVVAVFLLGLATGYRFWGVLTERAYSRRRLLRTLGFIELGIGGWALLFPHLFPLVQRLAYSAPDALAIDLLVACALLLPPTFLMGASIPLLTTALPERADEVSQCHAKIYGLNTLGAFFGALIAGFFLVPRLGLVTSLALGAIADIIVGLVFVFNRLEGSAHKAEDIPRIPNRLGAWGIYLFVFVTGGVSIALEVLFMRVLSLSIGPLHVVFPIVVGVVILGLAIGSLSLRRRTMTAARVPIELAKLSAMLALLYLTVPYWPYWLSCVRVSLATIPNNHAVFLALVVMFTALLLLPVFIPMGRLLPTGYALIDKTRDDFGNVCGRVYFANTLGTVAGAVGLGYVMFRFMDMPWIFKITLALPLLLASLLCLRSRWKGAAAACAAAAALALALPAWDRVPHVAGIYRFSTAADFHFRSVFEIPRRPGLLVHMVRDDPGVTVSAFSMDFTLPGLDRALPSTTISVNGKSDGNTVADYSNMVLTGVLPYLHAPRELDLDVAVVGLGTGLSSGAIAGCADVRSVTTLEISPGVIEAAQFFEHANFGLLNNPKSHIVQIDAFRFFARSGRKFDIITSEPSNVWVVGVENLFTPEFYALANDALSDDGVFFQWFQMYEMNTDILRAIAANVLDEFPYAALFAVGASDVGIMASRRPLQRQHAQRRLAEEHVRATLAPMGIDDLALISLLEIYPSQHLAAVAFTERQPRHSVEFPWIGPAASKSRFLHERVRLGGPVMHDIGRHLPVPEYRRVDFARWMSAHATDMSRWCSPSVTTFAAPVVCTWLQPNAGYWRSLMQPTTVENLRTKLDAYSRLRQQGFIGPDLAMLEEAARVVRESAGSQPHDAISQAIGLIVLEYADEWQWEAAVQTADSFRQSGVLSEAEFASSREQVLERGMRGRATAEQLEAGLKQRRQGASG